MCKRTCLSLLFLLLISGYVVAQTVSTDSLVRVLESTKVADTNKVNTYQLLARAFRFTDPATAIIYGKQGIILANKLNFDKGSAGCYLNVSTAFAYSERLDTAMLYLDTALQYAHKVNDPNRLGLAYLNRADYHRQLVNFSQSLKDCETALSYADRANNDDVRARVNQVIGSVYTHQELYDQSISYYNKAIDLYLKVGNYRMIASVLSNLGLIHKGLHDYKKAEEVTLKAIYITDSLKDITNLSIFNGNLSDVYFQMKKYTEALLYADRAMEYARLQQNEPLMGTASLHQASVYVEQKQFSKAIEATEKALAIFRENGYGEEMGVCFDILADAYARSGNYSKGFEYMRLSKDLGDSLNRQQYETEIASLQTKFSVNEKDQQILLLGTEKKLQQQRLNQQRIIMIASIIVAGLALMGIWLAINRYRLRQQMKELELRTQIAADLHDEVGSSLSSIHMLSQMARQQGSAIAGQQEILTSMSNNARETMEKMGDIVWMIKPGVSESNNLLQRMEHFANEMGSGKNIGLSLELQELEKIKLSIEQRKNIYLIFKEAINNAVKYSDAHTITAATRISGRELILSVKDDGKGFDNLTMVRGNGLDNMQYRASEMGGRLTIESAEGMGTVIKLRMPFNIP
jgi:signal transduction histidine kinase